MKQKLRSGLPRTNQICAAFARVGDIDILQCALIHGYPWTGIASKSAAFAGYLHVLKWAKDRLAWDKHVCEGSAQGGHLEVLRWARQNGCAWESSRCRGRHLKVLKWARQHGCRWDAIFIVAARADYLDTSDTCNGWTPPLGLIPGPGYSSEEQVLLRVDKLDQVSYHVQVCHGEMLHGRLKVR